ncbi:Rap1a/Tai family immunity protein [Marinobacter oulmenensis]|uniref:Rap1a immunity protein domain-containing protein n=1 Tax=Marinobacter oulmenensis TaxID=643747 RepID=A0A840UNI6_9GAMM|nr:Rap1a/Tai family immunity protein [Marinobacter oulmenensis]MBB5322636.1 hypothetical protein [Marinobacter oulmenensis]
MKMNLLKPLMILFLLTPALAQAGAEKILSQCQIVTSDAKKANENPISALIEMGYCLGYVAGVSDYSTVTADMASGELESLKSCRPPSALNEQLAKVVVKFLEDNPKLHHLDEATLVALALHDAFPCN